MCIAIFVLSKCREDEVKSRDEKGPWDKSFEFIHKLISFLQIAPGEVLSC
jgi:hypothetical protein